MGGVLRHVGIPILREMACVEGLESQIDCLNGTRIKVDYY